MGPKGWFLLVVGLLLPVPFAAAAVSPEERGVVTGHTIYFDANFLNDSLAGIVGIAQVKIVWFNGFSLYSKFTSGWVYAVEADTGNPTKEDLVDTGNDRSYDDPNGYVWLVKELYYEKQVDGAARVLGASPSVEKVYVWAVQVVDPPAYDTSIGEEYNFVLVVDASKMTFHEAKAHSHEEGAPPHVHDSVDVDLYFAEVDPATL